MEFKSIKSRGFTLMELLIVIVILALLVLMAGPQLLRIMQRSQRNSFRTEVQEMIQIMEQAFTMKNMGGVAEGEAKIDIKDGKRILCMTLEGLQSEGYLKKGLSAGGDWNGKIVLTVPTDGGASEYSVSITNGTYYVRDATLEAIANDTTGTVLDKKPDDWDVKKVCSTAAPE